MSKGPKVLYNPPVPSSGTFTVEMDEQTALDLIILSHWMDAAQYSPGIRDLAHALMEARGITDAVYFTAVDVTKNNIRFTRPARIKDFDTND